MCCFRVCHAFMSVHCSLVITCWERDNLFALVCVMFYCVLSLSHVVSWVRCGTWLYRFLIFASLLTLIFICDITLFYPIYSSNLLEEDKADCIAYCLRDKADCIAYCLRDKANCIAYCLRVKADCIAYCLRDKAYCIAYCLRDKADCIAYCLRVKADYIVYCLRAGGTKLSALPIVCWTKPITLPIVCGTAFVGECNITVSCCCCCRLSIVQLIWFTLAFGAS